MFMQWQYFKVTIQWWQKHKDWAQIPEVLWMTATLHQFKYYIKYLIKNIYIIFSSAFHIPV